MNTVYILLGVAVLALAVVDSLWTTLWVDAVADAWDWPPLDR